jgi:hypothetical protein
MEIVRLVGCLHPTDIAQGLGNQEVQTDTLSTSCCVLPGVRDTMVGKARGRQWRHLFLENSDIIFSPHSWKDCEGQCPIKDPMFPLNAPVK